MIAFLQTLASHPIIPAFLMANLAIGVWAHRKAKVNSFEDYALASRSLPTGVLVMTLLGTFVAGGSLTDPGWAYKYGVLQILGPLCYIFSFLIIGTFLAPCLVYFTSAITIGDMMHTFYGRVAQILTSLVGLLVSLLVVSSQIQTIGKISGTLLGINPTVAVVFFGAVVIIYSALGGIRSVSYTDILQTITALSVLLLICQTLLHRVGGFQFIFTRLPAKKLAFFEHPKFFSKLKIVSFWVLFPTFLLTPPIVQRMFVTTDKKKVRRMWYLSSWLYGIISFSMVLIGIAAFSARAKLGLDSKPSQLLPDLIKILFAGKDFLLGFVFLGMISLLISTVDSFLHSMSVSITHDLIEPIIYMRRKKNLKEREKVVYSRLVTVTVGCVAIAGSFIEASSWLTNLTFYSYAIFLYAMVLVPWFVGVIGIKTDRISLIAFCLSYSLSLLTFSVLGWDKHGYFLVAIFIGIVAYFLAHIIQNRGIVTLKRSELTVAERLWLPSWSGLRKKVMGLVKAPLHLPTLADRKVVHTPMHPLAFSMLVFGLYTLSSIFASGGGEGTAHFMAAIHFVGITLCCGLMLKGIWPASLKPYFPLYWFVTLFYCLPFGGTLSILQSHAGVADASLWMAKMSLLAFLVDSSSFLIIALLGTAVPCFGWYLLAGSLPQDIFNAPMIMAFVALLVNFLGVLLFGRSKEARTNERFYWNRIASSILGHDLRGSTQMLGGVGNMLEKTFEISEPSTNGKGEKGYWLPFAQSEFLAQFSTDMSKKAASTRKDISNFLAFIQSQIMGTFEQKAVSMRAMAEEGMEKIDGKVKSSRIKLSLETKQDFEAKVLSGIFPNVIGNLLMNATTHGKASEITVTVDGHTRTITVRDNGEGIPSDVLPRIFELSYSTAAQGKENSGVGLAFVKMVLDTSDAKISCHSRTGKGSFTEFVITFEKA